MVLRRSKSVKTPATEGFSLKQALLSGGRPFVTDIDGGADAPPYSAYLSDCSYYSPDKLES